MSSFTGLRQVDVVYMYLTVAHRVRSISFIHTQLPSDLRHIAYESTQFTHGGIRHVEYTRWGLLMLTPNIAVVYVSHCGRMVPVINGNRALLYI